jgi:hypothetical protein
VLLLTLCACSETGSLVAPPDSGAGATEAGVDAAPEAAPDSANPIEAATDASDARADRDAAPDAFVPALPIVNNTFGGAVLAHPRLVPVVYSTDTMAPAIEDFVAKLAASAYFTAATSEYGVGSATATPAVVITDPPPTVIQGTDIATWVAANAAGSVDGGAAWPAPDGNTVYIVFYPDGTTIEEANQGGGTSVSCRDFGGYHDEATGASGGVTFGVIARCNGYLGLSGTDFVTYAASHEAVEAATDPLPQTAPAFFDVDFAGSGWSTASGGSEIGDLCKVEKSSQIRPADIGYLVQRIWSNAAARGVHDPCAPAPAGEAYFLAVPDMTGAEVYPGYYAQGISVASGSSTTVDVHLYADTPGIGTWTVAASEPTLPQLPDPYGQLTFSLDRTTGASGDVLHLTVKRRAAPKGQPAFGAPFVITSTQGTATHSYWGVVGN